MTAQTKEPLTLTAYPSPQPMPADGWSHRQLNPDGVPYEWVADRLPVSKFGTASITHFDFNERSKAGEDFNWQMRLDNLPLAVSGRYARLCIAGELFMTDTPMERVSNAAFINRAVGHVLIFGLGIGMVLPPLLAKLDVLSVTVVELNSDVIGLVAPHYAHPKLTVVQGDAYAWEPGEGYTPDTVYFDIWPDMSWCENLPQMKTLMQRARKWLKASSHPGKSVDCWMIGRLKETRRREQQRERRGTRVRSYWF